MDKLPKDVLELILSRLEDVRDLCSCDRAGRFFHHLSWRFLALETPIDDLTTQMDLSPLLLSTHTDKLEKLFIRCNNVRESSDWLLIRRFQESLRILDLRAYERHVNIDIWNIIKGFGCLEILNLSGFSLTSSFPEASFFPNLKTLSLIHLQNISSMEISSLVTASPRLEWLKIRCDFDGEDYKEEEFEFDVDLPLVISNAQNLKTLDINAYASCSVQVTNCNKLEQVKLANLKAVKFNPDCSFIQVHELELNCIYAFSNDDLSTLLSNCMVLKKLTLVLDRSGQLKSPIRISSASLTTLFYGRKTGENKQHILQLQCSGLESLTIDLDCLVKAEPSSMSKVSSLVIAGSWKIENILVVLGLVAQSLVHLNMSELQSCRWRTEILAEMICKHLEGSPLREIEVCPGDLGLSEAVEDVQCLVKVCFNAHPHLMHMKVMPDTEELEQVYKTIHMPGFSLEVVGFADKIHLNCGTCIMISREGKDVLASESFDSIKAVST